MTSTESDFVRHYTDGQSVEELAKRFPGSAESHVVLHRKLDVLAEMIMAVAQRMDDFAKKFEH